MATTTTPLAYGAAHEQAADATPAEGFWARMFRRLVEARMAHARVHVNSYLAQLSDERLSDLGFTPDQAKAIRNKNQVPASYLS